MAQVEPVEPFHGTEQNLRFALTMYWDTGTLTWVKGTQGSGGGDGGGTEYTQDAAAPANPVGPVRSLVRVDTPSSVGADGDIVTQKGTAYGAAYVTLLDASGATPTIGGGVQYTEGDTDASITGTTMLMEGGSNTLVPAQGTVADGLLVNLGNNNDVVVTGTTAVGAKPATASASFTRPADTTAYAAGDVVCNSTSSPTAMTFSSMAVSAGAGGMITKVRLILDTNPATKPTYMLFLYRGSSAPAIDNDNSAYTPTTTELGDCVATIPLGLPVVGDVSSTSTNTIYWWTGAWKYVTSGSTSLFGILTAQSAVTPASADVYAIEITADLDPA